MTDFTMQSSKGFNPFLMESDYAAAPVEPMYAAAADAASSNPFLGGFDAAPEPAHDIPGYSAAAPTGGDNPFLNYSYQPPPSEEQMMAPGPNATTGAHNPFADFGAPAAAPLSGRAHAYFSSTADMSYAHQTHEPEHQLIDTTSEPSSSMPHQTTQSLLESVTGALEATSDSLLDRLRVTAPSPTPDLPSPTPSPRSPSPDLLLGDDQPPPPPPSANPLNPSPHQFDSIIDLFDAEPVPSGPKSSAEILGLYNTMTVTTAKPAVPVQEVPSSAAVHSLVDLVIEPATPKLFDMEDKQEDVAAAYVDQYQQVPSVTSPPAAITPTKDMPMSPEKVPEQDLLSPEAPQKPKPPKPPTPVKQVPPAIPPEPVRPPAPTAFSPTASPSRGAPPERPKPPPVPAPPRSPVHEVKPLPSRPPPPVPPAPRASPQPPQVPPSPAVQPQPPMVPSAPVVPDQQPYQSPFAPSVPFEPVVLAAPPPPAAVVHQEQPPPPQPFKQPQQAFYSEPPKQPFSSTGVDIFGSSKPQTDPFSAAEPTFNSTISRTNGDTFDDFDKKFESLSEIEAGKTPTTAFGDPFGGSGAATGTATADSGKC
jgi:hypothetical protein